MILPGNLRATTLGDLLGRLHRQGVTGILELIEERSATAGRVHRVHLRHGLVTSVESALAVPPIGEVLLRAGAMDGAQHGRLLARLRRGDAVPTGAFLVREGTVSPEALDSALAVQLRMRVDAMYRLEHASVRFHAGRVATGRTLPATDFLHGRPRARDGRKAQQAGKCAAAGASASTGARLQALAVLGLREGASRDQVRHAFRRLACAVHPDLHPGAAEPERVAMERRFSRYSAAYHLLITQV
jgi:hypothetical protein